MSKFARNKSREMRRAQQAIAAQRKRTRLLGGIGATVIAGLLVAIIAVVVNVTSKDDTAPTSGQLVNPANLSDTGAIPVGPATAPVTLEIYLDYMCPACGMFEKANGDEIDRLMQAGKVKLALRPISFLDRTSQGTKYSTRAANAVATVADRAPSSVWAFSTALYENQPKEGTRGLSDEQIADVALGAGVPQEVVNAFPQRIFEPWVAKSTEAAFGSGIQGTPTVKINGTVFKGDVYSVGPLTQAIEAAAGGGGQ